MNSLHEMKKLLREASSPEYQKRAVTFFKTGPDDYGAHDQFLGIRVPILRTIAKKFHDTSLDDIVELLASPYNEERLLALLMMVQQYQQGDHAHKQKIYDVYVANLAHVNNWNLVDSSAPYIMGPHLFGKHEDALLKFVVSDNLWIRRCAIVATLHFIRQGDLRWTFKLARMLLNDSHDLMHKATGWMLREAGKVREDELIKFLDVHAGRMPRVMLRYALERLSKEQKNYYLRQVRSKPPL